MAPFSFPNVILSITRRNPPSSELKQYAIDLGLNPEPAGAGKGTGGVQSSVEFQVGVPFSALRGTLGAAAAGVHTMRDEHFGIGVVEYMVRDEGVRVA